MQSHLNHAGDAPGIKLAIVGPDGFDGMVQHVEELAKAGVPFVFDPSRACRCSTVRRCAAALNLRPM